MYRSRRVVLDIYKTLKVAPDAYENIWQNLTHFKINQNYVLSKYLQAKLKWY